MQMLNTVNKHKNIIFLVATSFIILIGTAERLIYAWNSKGGGDYDNHLEAIVDLLEKRNPYITTIRSYKNLERNPNDKGYAYLPGIMYTNSALYLTHLILVFNFSISLISMPFLMYLPGIFGGISVAVLFIKLFYKKDNLAMFFCTLLWIYNPYFYLKNALEGYDMFTIALMVWALYYLKKDDVISGMLFALAVIFKTFPIILGPIFLFKAKNKKDLVLASIITGILFSLPFMKSWEYFGIYLQGAVFVHGERFMQGRPYLWYISYLWDIITIRLIPFKIYSTLSIISSWVIATGAIFLTKLKDRYTLAILPFLTFYFFTPVLNKTYTIWVIPIFLIGLHRLFGENRKLKILFYVLNVAYYIFIFWYLAQWRDGFDVYAGFKPKN